MLKKNGQMQRIMEAFEIKSDVPIMKFCEFCYATLNENGTCPTEGCIHNDLMDLEEDDADVTSPTQL